MAGENRFARLLGITSINQNETNWISLVVQWIRMCLPMQGPWLRKILSSVPGSGRFHMLGSN